jgi:hypothetical protein
VKVLRQEGHISLSGSKQEEDKRGRERERERGREGERERGREGEREGGEDGEIKQVSKIYCTHSDIVLPPYSIINILASLAIICCIRSCNKLDWKQLLQLHMMWSLRAHCFLIWLLAFDRPSIRRMLNKCANMIQPDMFGEIKYDMI